MSVLKKIGVLGAGNMGSGIAQKLAQEGYTVVMRDVDQAAVDRGMTRIQGLLNEAVERKILSQADVDAVVGRIQGCTALDPVADCDLVIEAIFEDEELKKKTFGQLDELCKPKTILATNTSSFTVGSLAEATRRPDRVVGLHFFFHPAKNRLLEIIPADRTSGETVERCVELAKGMQKIAIFCKDRSGFVVNRFFVPWINEAVRLLEGGAADIATIEAAAKEAFGLGMGPFELLNATSGTGIEYHSCNTLARAFGSFYPPASLVKAQMDKAEPWDLSGVPDESKFPAVAARLLGVTFQVVGEILDDRIGTLEDVETGAKIGLRWPAGPFEMMNARGIRESVALAEAFCSEFGVPLAKRLAERRDAGTPWPIRFVQARVAGGIATLTINRPEAMNALNQAVVAQLGEALDEAVTDPAVKGIVLEGAGKAFVGGADLKFFIENVEAGALDKILDFARQGHALLRCIEKSPKPVVAKVDGLSLGGGTELALACHAIVVSEKGSFGFPETGIGIYPGFGGTQRMARILGKALAKYFVLTGAPMNAKTALELGLAAHLVPSAEIDEFVARLIAEGNFGDKYAPKRLPKEWTAVADAFSDSHVRDLLAGRTPTSDLTVQKAVQALARKAPIALQLANRIMDKGLRRSLVEGLRLELEHIDEIFRTEDALVGLKSVGKYRPEFKGQ